MEIKLQDSEKYIISRPLFDPRYENKNFKNIFAHLQDITNHILYYQLSTICNVDGVQGTRLI